ncbi:hypothetical protein IFR05_009124 [Cadophora sp. M221]|nr:hypothetical protein IFR05_009124 [Cadophora sp. M221]
MKVPGDDEFFDFASFDQDFGNDLNILFAEPPATLDTPSVHQSESDPLATTSQQWNQPAPFGVQKMLDSVLPHVNTSATKLSHQQLDMNDPTVLSLYTQIVIFQQDTTRLGFVFPGPDYFVQDTLHAIARMLGLEYEFSVQLARVRLSRSNNLHPMNTVPVQISQTPDTAYNISVSATSGIQNPPVITDDAGDSGSGEVQMD